MKSIVFLLGIIIILFKTGNVLSNTNIFSVNNIKISKEFSKNKQILTNKAFKNGFDDLIKRLLLDEDYKKVSNIELKKIKELISYYQITESNEELEKDFFLFNIFFDKNKIHNFFFKQNILYSDIINTEIIFFPLLIQDKQTFIYSKNLFYENWIKEKKVQSNELIQYSLPVESIESIKRIEEDKENIFKLDVPNFFKEYEIKNKAFAIIEVEKKTAKIFLKTSIGGKNLNKTLLVLNKDNNQTEFYDKIIVEIKKTIEDLIKSQNLIDVRTPSFLNVEIKMTKKNSLIEFNKRLEKIDLIDNSYIVLINKDYALVKIKYLGKIDKIINKLKDQNMNLMMRNGQWQLNVF